MLPARTIDDDWYEKRDVVGRSAGRPHPSFRVGENLLRFPRRRLAHSRWDLRLPIGLAVIATVAVAVVTSTAASALSASFDRSCPVVGTSRVFLPWLDIALYELAPNGGFEKGAKGWSLRGDARVTSGNESHFVGGLDDDHSLSLPDNSSALSSPVCVGLTRPAFRLFTSNAGSAMSSLQVRVVYSGSFGVLSVLDGGMIVDSGAWKPTPQLLMLEAPLGSTSVQLEFTAVGSGGDWRIDDLYVDPFNSV
jgi:hypothetical protein